MILLTYIGPYTVLLDLHLDVINSSILYFKTGLMHGLRVRRPDIFFTDVDDVIVNVMPDDGGGPTWRHSLKLQY